MSDDKRINILTDQEVEDIYNRPHFSEGERQLFFKLSNDEEKILSTHRTLESKI